MEAFSTVCPSSNDLSSECLHSLSKAAVSVSMPLLSAPIPAMAGGSVRPEARDDEADTPEASESDEELREIVDAEEEEDSSASSASYLSCETFRLRGSRASSSSESSSAAATSVSDGQR